MRLPLCRPRLGGGARGALHYASRVVPTPLSHRRRVRRSSAKSEKQRMPIAAQCQAVPLFVPRPLRAGVFPVGPRRASHTTAMGARGSCTHPAPLHLYGRPLASASPGIVPHPPPCPSPVTTGPRDIPGALCRRLRATGCLPLCLGGRSRASALTSSGRATRPTRRLVAPSRPHGTTEVPCPRVRLSVSHTGVLCLGLVPARCAAVPRGTPSRWGVVRAGVARRSVLRSGPVLDTRASSRLPWLGRSGA